MNKNKAQPVKYQIFPEENGCLCIFQSGKDVNFDIKRVFTVSANKDDLRGRHAHLKCTQYLVCLSGLIELTCDDGLGSIVKFTLESGGNGVLIPPGVWGVQRYLEDKSILMVICDSIYDPDEYVTDYKTFLNSVLE